MSLETDPTAPDENAPAANQQPSSCPPDAAKIKADIQAAVEAQAWQSIERRLQRVDDYLQAAMEKPDPVEANVALTNSTLLRSLALMDPDITVALAKSLGKPEKSRQLLSSRRSNSAKRPTWREIAWKVSSEEVEAAGYHFHGRGIRRNRQFFSHNTDRDRQRRDPFLRH